MEKKIYCVYCEERNSDNYWPNDVVEKIFDKKELAEKYADKMNAIVILETQPSLFNYHVVEKIVETNEVDPVGKLIVAVQFTADGDMLEPYIQFYPKDSGKNYEYSITHGCCNDESNILRFNLPLIEDETIIDIHKHIIDYVSSIYDEVKPKLELHKYNGYKSSEKVFHKFS